MWTIGRVKNGQLFSSYLLGEVIFMMKSGHNVSLTERSKEYQRVARLTRMLAEKAVFFWNPLCLEK